MNTHDASHDAATVKPEPYVALRLFMSDGSSKGGIWTGREWWSEGRAVYPVRWQRIMAAEPDRPKG